MVRIYSLSELLTVLNNCADLVECFTVNRAVMLDKDFYTQNEIDCFLRMLDKRIGQLIRQKTL